MDQEETFPAKIEHRDSLQSRCKKQIINRASSPAHTRSGRVFNSARRQPRAWRTLRQQAAEEGDVADCEGDEDKAGSEAER